MTFKNLIQEVLNGEVQQGLQGLLEEQHEDTNSQIFLIILQTSFLTIWMP